MTEDTFGRNRKSITDLNAQLSDIFQRHPECIFQENEDGSETPVIPARGIPHVIASFSVKYGVTLMEQPEVEELEKITTPMDGLLVTPDDLIGFIAMVTADGTPPPPPPKDSPSNSSPADTKSPSPVDGGRGRYPDRTSQRQGSSSRASSNDSVVTSIYRPDSEGLSSSTSSLRVGSSPSLGKSPDQQSRFDSDTRQRAVPLHKAPPSAFSRRPQPLARRRKSDGGTSFSDSESPLAEGRRSGGRARAPSNPVSPSSTSTSFQSFPLPASPNSSATFSPDSSYEVENSFSHLQSRRKGMGSSGNSPSFEENPGDDSLDVSGMLELRNGEDSGSDSDLETSPFNNMILRSPAASFVSLSSPEERAEAMARTNDELMRKLEEKEAHFMARFSEHEQVIDELQSKVDQMRTELGATKKEEKELRVKESRNTIQLNTLEAEVSKLQRQLDTSRASYQNLQKQYQEQISESERYRNSLRSKDATIKDLEDIAHNQTGEVAKAKAEKEMMESTFMSLQEELEIARQAHHELEEQKQENLLLKETIDRLRFDLDELRTTHANATNATGVNSNKGSMSRSLANELKAKLEAADEEESDDDEAGGDLSMTSVGTAMDSDEDNEYIETIITAQRRRKVGSRANKQHNIVRVEETKSYADAYTQHNPLEFCSSAFIQTDPLPTPPSTHTIEIQTEPEVQPVILTASVEIQTEVFEEDVPEEELVPEAGPSRVTETLESSTEAVRPLTPSSPSTSASSTDTLSFPPDSPPSYENIAGDEKHKLLQRLHPGMPARGGVRGGVSSTAVREWSNLKQELGFDCVAIDRALQASSVTGERHDHLEDIARQHLSQEWAQHVKTSAAVEDTIVGDNGRPRRRFYNIYNTYFLNGRGAAGDDRPPFMSLKDFAWLGLGVSLAFVATSIMEPKERYEDRTYWSAFNNVGGHLGPDGLGHQPALDAVWVVIEKVVKGSLAAALRVPPHVIT